MKRNLSRFEYGSYSIGKPKWVLALWVIFGQTLLNIRFLPSSVRVYTLKLYGADIGQSVILKSKVTVLFPWRLSIGSNSWIGENVLIINHEYVEIGKNVCVSQRAILCSGGHDYKSVSLAYKHSPIKICDGAWVCLDSKVLGGSNIGEGSVIAASEVVRRDIPDYTMLRDEQIRRIEPPSLP